MNDIKASVKASLTDTGHYGWRNFGDFELYETEDGSELFVEMFSKSNHAYGNAVVNVSRLVALGVMDAVENEYEQIHLTVMLKNNVVRLTIGSDMFDLDEDELNGRIAQSLRIS